MSVGDKLRHNYHELTLPERLWYLASGRKRLSAEQRFFFEGIRGQPGQMYIADRKGLYDAIVTFRPRYCIEVGTGSGGGSTYFLAKAFEAIGGGTLYTIEAHQPSFHDASAYYRRHLPSLAPIVEFRHGASLAVLRDALERFDGLDACFLDGADDRDATVGQYEFLRPWFRPGTIMMAHDWNTEKMAALRPLVESDPAWLLIDRMDQPESVGFVVYRRA